MTSERNEPPFDFETVARDLLTDSIGDGCCGNDSWRGHLCQYHQGFEDGMDALMERFAAWMPKADDA